MTDKWKLTPGKLRRLKDPGSWKVKGTDEWGPGRKGVGLIGQERAVESISFGLMVPGRGYNIFVTGQPGSGRTSYALERLRERAAELPAPDDWL